MARFKKVLISLPNNLLEEIDNAVLINKTSRSDFVREAMRVYLTERRKIEIREKMKKGYEEMAEINIRLSEVYFDADNDQQNWYEKRLREME